MDQKDWSELQAKWAVVPGSRLLGARIWLWTAFAFATGRSWVEAGQQLSPKRGSLAAVPVAAPICPLSPVAAATETTVSSSGLCFPQLSTYNLTLLFHEFKQP